MSLAFTFLLDCKMDGKVLPPALVFRQLHSFRISLVARKDVETTWVNLMRIHFFLQTRVI